MVAPIAHTKYVGTGNGGTTPPIDTTGANFAVIFYTFYNGTDYPVITDNYGNSLGYTFARENVFSPAMACEMIFTHEFVGGPGHTFTIAGAGLYGGGLNAASLYVEVFSGVKPGSNSAPEFTDPWYNDGGNATTVATALSCSPGSAGGTNGQLIVVGWGNSDPSNDTVITATDGLSGTPVFTITDSDRAVLPLPGLTNFNAGLAYYIQPVATSTNVTQTWAAYVDLYPHDGANGQAVMSAGVFLPSPDTEVPLGGVSSTSGTGVFGVSSGPDLTVPLDGIEVATFSGDPIDPEVDVPLVGVSSHATASPLPAQVAAPFFPNAVQGWVLDIDDDLGNPLLHGVPLVTGTDLLVQYGYLNIGGQLIVQTDHDVDTVPTFANLGSLSHLYFLVVHDDGSEDVFEIPTVSNPQKFSIDLAGNTYRLTLAWDAAG